MASKNLLPVVALRTKSVERHCVQAFFDRTGRNLNLGMPSS